MKKIAIVAGGDSSEYGVSLRSAAGIYSFLNKDKYAVTIVCLRGNRWQALSGTDEELAKNNGVVPVESALLIKMISRLLITDKKLNLTLHISPFMVHLVRTEYCKVTLICWEYLIRVVVCWQLRLPLISSLAITI